MKKPLLLIILAIAFIKCTNEPEFFTVSGEIENANGEKLYLVELQNNNIVLLDSVILSDEGIFSFKGQNDIPKFYALRTTPDNYITLVINPLEQIIIEADGRDFAKNPTIIGSPDSEMIKVLRMKLESSIEALDSMGIYYRSVIGTSEQYKIRDSLALASKNIIEDHTEFTKNFIINNPASLASLMALYQQIAPRRYVLNPTDHMEYFNMVDSALSIKYPGSEAVRALHSQVAEIKRQKNADESLNQLVGIGNIAPDISLPSPEGDTISLSSLKGKYVLLDFWASWCRPCRIENPHLVKSYQKYNDKGFEIFQVSLDKKKESWIDAIENDGLSWYHVSDLQYWNSAPAKVYQVQGIPANFLLDKQGRIIAKNLRGDALEAKLSEIFD